jgi:hypothetical protein
VTDASTGLYIGSRFAAMANTTAVHQKMFINSQIPKPANFINTLSNSAGFYVARNLGLESKNIFVSRGDCSMEAAMELAIQDLQAGRLQQALVGVVDEAVLPLRHHRQRLGVAEMTPLAEGSHWFLLTASFAAQGLASIQCSDSCRDKNSLLTAVKNTLRINLPLTIIGSAAELESITQELSGENQIQHDSSEVLGTYPAKGAGQILRYIQSANKTHAAGQLLSINQDQHGRYFYSHIITH